MLIIINMNNITTDLCKIAEKCGTRIKICF